MKILQVNTSVNMGSVGRRAEDIGNMLIKKGHESYVAVSSRLKRPSTSKLITIGNQYDVLLHGIKSRVFDKQGYGSKKATQNFVKRIIDIDPDVIHLRNIHGYYINIEVLFNYLAEANKPVVWSFHDCWPFTGHCAYFDKMNCYKWKTECYECPGLSSYPKSFGMDNSKANYALKKRLFTSVKNMTPVGVCHWIGDHLKESFFKNYPIEVIYNGINTEVFNPDSDVNSLRSELQLTDEKIILGAANVWNSRKGLANFKGLDDFIEISAKLPPKVKIVLIGPTKEQQKDFPSNIIGVDRTNNLEYLASFYRMADVFVNPTYVDNFPTTNIEALSSGTPAVVYRTGGCPEAVDANTGIVVEKGDRDGLLKGVLTILDNGKESYTKLCRERALKYFDRKDNNEAYFNLYERLLAK